jgi:hypothetical protein
MTLAGNKTYVGTYKISGNDSVWKIQLFDTESEAKANYGQQILQKTEAGFVSYSNGTSTAIGPTVLGDTKAEWFSYKIESPSSSVFRLYYGFNDHINQWYVASITENL